MSRSSDATRPLKWILSTCPPYVSGINSRTIDRSRVFVAACEDRFILQADGEIITSDQFIEQIMKDDANRTT